MLKNNRRVCSRYKPLSILPQGCANQTCSHCEYYSPRGCHRNFYDALEEADSDL